MLGRKRIILDSSEKIISVVNTLDKNNYLTLSPTLNGLSSLIILITELSKIDNSNDYQLLSEKYINSCLYKFKNSNFSLSTYTGITGFGYALLSNTDINKKNISLLNKITSLIANNSKDLIKNSKFLINDCFFGLSGIGRFLLNNNYNSSTNEAITLIISKINSSLKCDIEKNDFSYGWFDFNKLIKQNTKVFNLSMSHGIAGIISFLSISILEGFDLQDTKETLKHLLAFLYKFKIYDDNFYKISTLIPLETYLSKSPLHPNHDLSWCYGSISIARSIYLAGIALDDRKYINDSLEILISNCKNFNPSLFNLPTFCHGLSGYLNIINIFKRDIQNSILDDAFINSEKNLLDYYNINNKFGFFSNEVEDNLNNNLNIVVGAISSLLPLIELEKNSPSRWNNIFMLN